MQKVRDIAKVRNVKAGSVSPAMKRLANLGLINYNHREYIDLSEKGEKIARKIFARHKVLEKFLREVLGVPEKIVKIDACRLEHHLSDESVDHLVKFLEFLHLCPKAKDFINIYRSCPQINPQLKQSKRNYNCEHKIKDQNKTKNCEKKRHGNDVFVELSTVKQGQKAIVAQVKGEGQIRQRILDMGILPNIEVEVERFAPTGDPIWVKLQGFQLSLRLKEAKMIRVKLI